jgi:hypothetical protein
MKVLAASQASLRRAAISFKAWFWHWPLSLVPTGERERGPVGSRCATACLSRTGSCSHQNP